MVISIIIIKMQGRGIFVIITEAMKNTRSPLQEKIQTFLNQNSPFKSKPNTKRSRKASPGIINMSHEH